MQDCEILATASSAGMQEPSASCLRPSSGHPALSHVVLLLSCKSPCCLSSCRAEYSCTVAHTAMPMLLSGPTPAAAACSARSFPAERTPAGRAVHAVLTAACAAAGAEGMRLDVFWVLRVSSGVAAVLPEGQDGIMVLLLDLC